MAWGQPLVSTSASARFSLQEDRPWEQRLRRFSFGWLKTIRRWSIRASRYLRRTVQTWLTWVFACLGLLLAGAVASALDLRLVRVWRRKGAKRALQFAAVGAALFFRLLLERRMSWWSRLPVLIALVYGVASVDLIRDNIPLIGWLDDIVVAGIACRWFVRRCPDEVVEEYAFRIGNRQSPPATPS